MGLSYSVQANGKGVHSSTHQAAVHFFSIEESVGNHAPVVAATADFFSDLVYVRPQKRFSACQHYGKLLVSVRYGVQGPEEIVKRHILVFGRDKAVAAAVAATEIASLSTFPEKIIELVDLCLEPSESAKKERAHYSALLRTTEVLPKGRGSVTPLAV